MLSDPILRAPLRGDIPTIGRLLLELGYDVAAADLARRIETISAHSDHFLQIAVDEEREVVGVVHAAMIFDLTAGAYVEITALVVSATTRRSGVGRALVRGVESWAARRGSYRVVVRSQLHRDAATQFYRELGYTPVKQQNVLVREPRELRPSGPKTIDD